MERSVDRWSIETLRARFLSISFPEYQRESTVWTRVEKQALIDSILRDFDIASFYFHPDEEESWECIDGRQRIHALRSFFGDSPEDDPDRCFPIRISNEIELHDSFPLPLVNTLTFSELERRAGADPGEGLEPQDIEQAATALERIKSFKITVIELAQVRDPSEFNLQFTRLNLGKPINAAEKLKAMTGEMRNLCFRDGAPIGKHRFIRSLGIPSRRYAKEMTAAQILAQVFSLGPDRNEDGFVRTRHFDLQDFFKKNYKISESNQPLVTEVQNTLDALSSEIADPSECLKSRAIAVTLVVFAWKTRLTEDPDRLAKVSSFIDALVADLKELRSQMNSTAAVSDELIQLREFQRHLSQAAVEKLAVRERSRIFTELFERWDEHGTIREEA